MRFIVVALMLMSGTAMAEPQRQTFKNANGQIVGRSVTNNAGTTFYDAAGRNVGRSTTNNMGTTTFYNRFGQQTGTKGR